MQTDKGNSSKLTLRNHLKIPISLNPSFICPYCFSFPCIQHISKLSFEFDMRSDPHPARLNKTFQIPILMKYCMRFFDHVCDNNRNHGRFTSIGCHLSSRLPVKSHHSPTANTPSVIILSLNVSYISVIMLQHYVIIDHCSLPQ